MMLNATYKAHSTTSSIYKITIVGPLEISHIVPCTRVGGQSCTKVVLELSFARRLSPSGVCIIKTSLYNNP